MRDVDGTNSASGGYPNERRKLPRQRVYLRGKIAYPDNSFSADCIIRDLSPEGAKVSVSPLAVTQDPFLIIVQQAVAHMSRTAWSTPQFAGLRFLEATHLGRDVPRHLRAIQRLWVDLAPR
jgi:hypothetical protein